MNPHPPGNLPPESVLLPPQTRRPQIKAVNPEFLGASYGPVEKHISHNIAPLLQKTIGTLTHRLGIEPEPTAAQEQLLRFVQHVENIDSILTNQKENEKIEKLRKSIVVLNENSEETFVDPNSNWGRLSYAQRKRILYKKRLDMAHETTDPTAYSQLDKVCDDIIREIDSNCKRGFNLTIQREYGEPLLFQNLVLRGESSIFRNQSEDHSHGLHTIRCDVTNGDLSISALNNSHGDFNATLTLKIPKYNSSYSYQRTEHQLPFSTITTHHNATVENPKNNSIWEFEHRTTDTHFTRPTTTTQTSTTVSNTHQLSQNIHLGLKLKTITNHPNLQETKQRAYGSIIFRYRDFFRVIWDDMQQPYPLQTKSDFLIELSSQGQIETKMWSLLNETDRIAFYFKLNPWKRHLVDKLDGGVVYSWQNEPTDEDLFGEFSSRKTKILPTLLPIPFSGSILAKTNGMIKFLFGTSVPGLASMYLRLSAIYNVFSRLTPSLGIELVYDTSHRPGYDTSTFMTPVGFEHYRLPILPDPKSYNEGLGYSWLISKFHQLQLALFSSQTERDLYYKQHQAEIDGHTEILARDPNYNGLAGGRNKQNGQNGGNFRSTTSKYFPANWKNVKLDGNLIQLHPEDQLIGCDQSEWNYIIHTDEFIENHPVLSQLPKKIAKLFTGVDENNHITLPSPLVLKRYAQRTVYPLPPEHIPGQVSQPRFANDEIEHMYYWGWFLRKKDTVLPSTVQEGMENPTIRFWMSIFRFQHLQSKVEQLKVLQHEYHRITKHLDMFKGINGRNNSDFEQNRIEKQADVFFQNGQPVWRDYPAFVYHNEQLKSLSNEQKALLSPYYSEKHPFNAALLEDDKDGDKNGGKFEQQQLQKLKLTQRSISDRRNDDLNRQKDILYQLQDLRFQINSIQQSEAMGQMVQRKFDEESLLAKKYAWATKFGVDLSDEKSMQKFDELDLVGNEDVWSQYGDEMGYDAGVYLRNVLNLNETLANYNEVVSREYGIDLDHMIDRAGKDYPKSYQYLEQNMGNSSNNSNFFKNKYSNLNLLQNGKQNIMSYDNDTYYGLDSSTPHPSQRRQNDQATTPLERYIGIKAKYLTYEAQKERQKLAKSEKRQKSLKQLEDLIVKSPLDLDESIDFESTRFKIGDKVWKEELGEIVAPVGHFFIDLYVGVNNFVQNVSNSISDIVTEKISNPTTEQKSPSPPPSWQELERMHARGVVQPNELGANNSGSSTRVLNHGNPNHLVRPSRGENLQNSNQNDQNRLIAETPYDGELPAPFGEYAQSMSRIAIEEQRQKQLERGYITEQMKDAMKRDGVIETLNKKLHSKAHEVFDRYGINDPEYHPVSEREIPDPVPREYYKPDPDGDKNEITNNPQNHENFDLFDDHFNTDSVQNSSENNLRNLSNISTLRSTILNRHDDETLPFSRRHIDQEASIAGSFASINQISDELDTIGRLRDLKVYDHQATLSKREQYLEQRLQTQWALADLERNEERLIKLENELNQIKIEEENQNEAENVTLSKIILPDPYTYDFEIEMMEVDEKGKELKEQLNSLEMKLLRYDEKVLELQVRALDNPSNIKFQDAYIRAKKERTGILDYYNNERKHLEKVENELESRRTDIIFRYTHRNTMLSQSEIDEHNLASQERFKKSILEAELAEKMYTKELSEMLKVGKDKYIAENPITFHSDPIISHRVDAKKQLQLDQRTQLATLTDDEIEQKMYQNIEEKIKMNLLYGKHSHDEITVIPGSNLTTEGLYGTNASLHHHEIVQDLKRTHGYYPFHESDLASSKQIRSLTAIGHPASSTLQSEHDRYLSLVAAGVISTEQIPIDLTNQQSISERVSSFDISTSPFPTVNSQRSQDTSYSYGAGDLSTMSNEMMQKNSLQYLSPRQKAFSITSPDDDYYSARSNIDFNSTDLYVDPFAPQQQQQDTFKSSTTILPEHVKIEMYKEIDHMGMVNDYSAQEVKVMKDNVEQLWDSRQEQWKEVEIAQERKDRWIQRERGIESASKTHNSKVASRSHNRLGLLDNDNLINSLQMTPQMREKKLRLANLREIVHGTGSNQNEYYDYEEEKMRIDNAHPDFIHSTALFTPQSIQPVSNWNNNTKRLSTAGTFSNLVEPWHNENPQQEKNVHNFGPKRLQYKDRETGLDSQLLLPGTDQHGNTHPYVLSDGTINKAYHPDTSYHSLPKDINYDKRFQDEVPPLMPPVDYPANYVRHPENISQSRLLLTPTIDQAAFVSHDDRFIPQTPSEKQRIIETLENNRLTVQLSQQHQIALKNRLKAIKQQEQLFKEKTKYENKLFSKSLEMQRRDAELGLLDQKELIYLKQREKLLKGDDLRSNNQNLANNRNAHFKLQAPRSQIPGSDYQYVTFKDQIENKEAHALTDWVKNKVEADQQQIEIIKSQKGGIPVSFPGHSDQGHSNQGQGQSRELWNNRDRGGHDKENEPPKSVFDRSSKTYFGDNGDRSGRH
jgi:hypothetical protein